VAAALVLTAAVFITIPAIAQEAGTRVGSAPAIMGTDDVNTMTFRTQTFVCGGKTQAGTPIGGNGTSEANGTSGAITISGIPPTATVVRADLIWTVLLAPGVDPATTTLGQTILFNGTPVTAFRIGSANEDPCFNNQEATVAWRAVVTGLVASPGNGVYTVSEFPGGSHFTEGVTLQILWAEPNAPLMSDNLYHPSPAGGKLAVTQGDLFSQNLTFAPTNAAGPVAARLLIVFGNGQIASENLRFDGAPSGDINLDDTLDGSTVAKSPGTCASTISNQCFWDDDMHNVAPQLANGATSASISSTEGSDCITWPAVSLTTSTDPAVVCQYGGIYVDNQCPPGNPWRNHGEYLSCVSDAAQRFLAGLPYGGTCPRAEIQSCIVNPRARSGVGKPR
jgi:hypothetical protein